MGRWELPPEPKIITAVYDRTGRRWYKAKRGNVYWQSPGMKPKVWYRLLGELGPLDTRPPDSHTVTDEFIQQMVKDNIIDLARYETIE